MQEAGKESKGSLVAEQKAEHPRNTRKQLAVAIGIAALILALGTPVIWFSLRKAQHIAETPDIELAEPESVQLPAGEEEVELRTSSIFPLETFVVNLNGGGFLRCQVQLEFSQPQVPEKFLRRLVPLRDSILTLLSGKTRSELGKEESRQKIKSEIRSLAAAETGANLVEQVYFTQFLVQ